MHLLALAAVLLLCGPAIAQQLPGGDRLPSGSGIVEPLRRGPDGKIQKLDPTQTEGEAGRGACRTGTLCVGPGRAYATLARAVSAVRRGDTIEIEPGTYHESVNIERDNVTVRSVGGRVHIDCAGLRPVQDKACVLLGGDNVTLEGLEISGAEIADGLGANAACVRNQPNRSFTLRRISCHHSQNGVLTDGGAIVIENSEFYENSWTGSTHNAYLSGNCQSVVVRGSTFRDARVAHEFKSRCQRTEISASIFRSTRGSRAIDIPDGGEIIISGGLIAKGAQAASEEIISFAPESCRLSGGSMQIKGVRFENARTGAVIHNFDNCRGVPIVLQGVTFEGIRPALRGYVLER
jgi:hypothetical protein